jgi:hypothetical protein
MLSPLVRGQGRGADMIRTVSSRQNLEQFEKEARKPLHDLRGLNAVSVERYFSFEASAGNFQPGLVDSQYVISRQYGVNSWQELKQSISADGDSS